VWLSTNRERGIYEVEPHNGKEPLLYLVVTGNFGLEYALRILVRLSRVNSNRLSQSHGMSELSREYFSLNVPRRIVVVIVKADLTPSYVAGVGHGFKTVVVISHTRSNKIKYTASDEARERRGKCIHVLLDIAGISLGFMSEGTGQDQNSFHRLVVLEAYGWTPAIMWVIISSSAATALTRTHNKPIF
jgi:hypothetical protein